ncbi:hypothetical protein R1sor_014740 [Riccia sorocarpa]|uniref:Reverse transcriptase zinc-binding domain-containing protein n=1 Tax=Riccia sorocarpa TaxID=122646 RepID=A0ABD3HC32_9MARC
MADSEEKWILAAELLIRNANTRVSWSRERQGWSRQEILLLREPKRIPRAPTVTGLLESWGKARKKFCIQNFEEVGSEMSVTQATILGSRQNWFSEAEAIVCRRTLKKEKISKVGEWKTWAEQAISPVRESREQMSTKEIGRNFIISTQVNWKLQDITWCWKAGEGKITGWILPSHKWKHLAADRNYEAYALNKKWARQDPARRWNKRMAKLWKSRLHIRDKTWWWKLIHQGIPTLERASKWRGDSCICKRCNQGSESVTHIFIDCRRAQKKWKEWDRLLKRNATTYNDKEQEKPLKVSILMAQNTLQAQKSAWTENSKQYAEIVTCLREIETCFEVILATSEDPEEEHPDNTAIEAEAGGDEAESSHMPRRTQSDGTKEHTTVQNNNCGAATRESENTRNERDSLVSQAGREGLLRCPTTDCSLAVSPL